MDNQDKIFDRFKKADENAPIKDFPGMEKVWSRVEQKLDKKEDKKTIALWKKIAIAASLLLLISLGAQFLRSNKTTVKSPEVVVNEKEKDATSNSVLKSNNALVSTDSPLVPKSEAVKILDKQIKQPETIAINEISNDAIGTGTNAAPIAYEVAPVAIEQSNYSEEESSVSNAKEAGFLGYSKAAQRESAKVAFSEQQSMKAKKSSPLIVINGNAIAHSDDVKKDKMMQAEIPNLQPENVDSLVVLDEPLYIIDGIYYSENDLFGKNPTSPYAPLNEQEIKTITILQDLEATSKYGERGKKGVVIITTKTGKPAIKK